MGVFYDFMPTRPDLTDIAKSNGRWAIVIGDVMGKGVPAGLQKCVVILKVLEI